MRERVEWLDHAFVVCEIDSRFPDNGGVYIFAGQVATGTWSAYYVGRTKSLLQRMPFHERWEEAEALCATHVHARIVPDQSRRLGIETRLVLALQPA